MRTLSYARPAQADLVAIDTFLVKQAGYGVAADQLDRIRQTADRLPQFPRLGALADVGPYRQFRVRGTPYTLIYRILPDQVQIVRVFHGAQDWRARLV